MPEELKDKEIPEMEKLIERLRMEKAKEEKEWKEVGLRDGKEDAAKTLSYSEFKGIEKGYGDLFRYDLTGDAIDQAMGSEWLSEAVSKLADNDPSFDEIVYLTAWLEGVMEVWQQVKDKL
jgi:hypothetical protein